MHPSPSRRLKRRAPSRITVGLVASAECSELEALRDRNKIIWPETPGLERHVNDLAERLIDGDTQVVIVDPPENLRLSQAGVLGAPWFRKRVRTVMLQARPWQPAPETSAEDAGAIEETPDETTP